jgi:hypothetical protein
MDVIYKFDAQADKDHCLGLVLRNIFLLPLVYEIENEHNLPGNSPDDWKQKLYSTCHGELFSRTY